MAALMQGMLTMMRLWNAFSSMGNMDLGGAFSSGSGLGGSAWPDPWGSAPWMGAPPTGMPWGGAGGRSPGGWPSGPGAGGAPGGSSGSQRTTSLEGRWQGTGGDALEFRGDRFRLTARGRGGLSGSFLVHGDRLVAYLPETNTTRIFRFELRGSYLALADESGQVLLFQRAGR
jgi:hypothetical protein